jgi:L-alanine-DL-glutamate epimerase-like enolase superfamily enzyme
MMDEPAGSPIDRVEVLALAPDLPRHAYTGHLDAPFTTSTLVRIADADGAEGLGQFDSDSHGAFDLAPLETLRTIAPRLPGRHPRDREALWDELRDHGTAADLPGVRSALDVALWDLAARRLGLPLRDLVTGAGGAGPDRLPAYASVPTLADAPAYADALARHREDGYTAAKVHAWGEPARDLAAMRAARDGGGDGVVLMYDAEGVLSRDGAAWMADALAEMGVRWFEAPLPDWDIAGYRALVRRARVPILPAGDAIWDPRLISDLLRDPPWHAMRFDVTFAGGVTSARRLFDVADAFDLDVELTGYGQTLVQAANLHVALAFGRTSYVERAVPVDEFEWGVTTPIRMAPDGTVGVGDGPGLAVELDDEEIDAAVIGRFAVDRSRRQERGTIR